MNKQVQDRGAALTGANRCFEDGEGTSKAAFPWRKPIDRAKIMAMKKPDQKWSLGPFQAKKELQEIHGLHQSLPEYCGDNCRTGKNHPAVTEEDVGRNAIPEYAKLRAGMTSKKENQQPHPNQNPKTNSFRISPSPHDEAFQKQIDELKEFIKED